MLQALATYMLSQEGGSSQVQPILCQVEVDWKTLLYQSRLYWQRYFLIPIFIICCLYFTDRSSRIWLSARSRYTSFNIKNLFSRRSSSYVESEAHSLVGTSTVTTTSPYSQTFTRESSTVDSITVKQSNHQTKEDRVVYKQPVDGYPSLSSSYSKQVILSCYVELMVILVPRVIS